MGVDPSKFGGSMRKLSCHPKNPKHFIALCFIELRSHPELRQAHELMVKVDEYKNVALFKCAYGYFLVDKNQKVSKEFLAQEKDAWAKLRQ